MQNAWPDNLVDLLFETYVAGKLFRSLMQV